MNIKPIETVYNGYKFRSRLEARWAVFFDAAGIPYQYEPEGYEIDGIKYLPDFYLPSSDAHVEVKPDRPGIENDILKCMKMIQWGGPIKTIIFLGDIPSMDWGLGGHLHFPALYYETGLIHGGGVVPGWWFFQDAFACDKCDGYSACSKCTAKEVIGHISGASYLPPFTYLEDENHFVVMRGEKISLSAVSDSVLRSEVVIYRENNKGRDNREWAEAVYNRNQMFYSALEKAKQARFEHGECG